MVRGAAFGLAAGMACALVMLVLSRLVMIPDAKSWEGAALAAAGILCALGNMLRKVSDRDAAVQADRCGLMERAATALDASPDEAADEIGRAMREMQIRDACEALENLDPKKIRSGSVRRPLAAAGIGCVLCAVMLLIPNAMDRKAEDFKALQVKLNRMTAEAEQAAKQDEAGLTEAEKQALRKLTEDLKRDLVRSRDEADAMVAIDRAEKRLEQMQSSTAGDAQKAMEAAQALSEALSRTGLDSLAQAVSAGDEQALAQALAGMDAETAEALGKVAEELSGEAKEAAEAMASAGEGGDAQQAASEAMNTLRQGQVGGTMSASAMQQALQSMKAAMSGTGSGSDGSQSGGKSPGSSGKSGTSGQGGSGAGSGDGAGQQMPGGSGTDGEKSAKPRSDPKYRESTYETIYDPEKADVGFRDVMTEQKRLGEDSIQIQAGEGKGTVDGSVPYGQVVGEYARTETQSADSENLTGQQREWVREYFRLLTEQN